MDLHCEKILSDYKKRLPILEKLRKVALDLINKALEENNLVVTVTEARIKTEKSFIGKLELKGHKYKSINDITDLVGARVVTYYNNQVDKVSGIIENLFEVDRENSVDKRKIAALNSFGYMSLHYICRIPKEIYFDPECPEINEFWFEVQMRSALQHVWATIYHDTGYKSDVEVPKGYLRSLNRLAGLLEIADKEFDYIRVSLEDYRRRIKDLISKGDLKDIQLDGDGFKNYLQSRPFDALLYRIAAINAAEIHHASKRPYLNVLIQMGFENLADVEKMRTDYSEDAYKLALTQIGKTDLNIIASNIALKNLCIVYLLKNSEDPAKQLLWFHNTLYGEKEKNKATVARLIKHAIQAGIINE